MASTASLRHPLVGRSVSLARGYTTDAIEVARRVERARSQKSCGRPGACSWRTTQRFPRDQRWPAGPRGRRGVHPTRSWAGGRRWSRACRTSPSGPIVSPRTPHQWQGLRALTPIQQPSYAAWRTNSNSRPLFNLLRFGIRRLQVLRRSALGVWCSASSNVIRVGIA